MGLVSSALSALIFRPSYPSKQSLSRIVHLYVHVQSTVDMIIEYQCSFEMAIECRYSEVLHTILSREYNQDRIWHVLSVLRDKTLLACCNTKDAMATLDILCLYFNLFFGVDERLVIAKSVLENTTKNLLRSKFIHLEQCIVLDSHNPIWNKHLFTMIIPWIGKNEGNTEGQNIIEKVLFPLNCDLTTFGIGRSVIVDHLFDAVANNDVPLLEFLLRRAKFCHRQKKTNGTWAYQSVLQFACARSNRNMQVIRIITKIKPLLVNKNNSRGKFKSCLMEASMRRDYELMEFLLKHGAHHENYSQYL